MNPVTIVSVRTGRVRELQKPDWDHGAQRTWRTAYGKDEVAGRVRAGTLGLEGDEQAATDVHGGPHMALLAYAASHYPLWHAVPGLEAMGAGAFGENLVWEGADETSVCVGDVWESDHVAFEVSKPRGPCAAISRWWNMRGLLKQATETARVGWYLRVHRQGDVGRGDVLRLAARPHPEWTVARVFRLKLDPASDPTGVRELSTLAALSPRWREHFGEAAARLG